MGIFDFLTARNRNTASTAKDRLRILIQQERSMRGAPDYLPLLQRELLEVLGRSQWLAMRKALRTTVKRVRAREVEA